MKDISSYKEYEKLFDDDLVRAVRLVLEYIETKGDYEFEDSYAHNALKAYFNKFGLHKALRNNQQFKDWNKDGRLDTAFDEMLENALVQQEEEDDIDE